VHTGAAAAVHDDDDGGGRDADGMVAAPFLEALGCGYADIMLCSIITSTIPARTLTASAT